MTSLLTDELLGELIAVGEVDILVGLPTQNHEKSVGPVVRAVVSAFSGAFVRQRTVLLNVDGGSTDGTREAIRRIAPAAELVSAEYALRTIHRISAPYHGIPGRGSALRILLTAAELLRARAVVLLDPSADSLRPHDVEAFVNSVWSGEADYVKPALPRAYGDGPLVTQIVRPLFGAAFGQQLLEPIDTELACSARFVSNVLPADLWNASHAETGVDAFLTAYALGSGVRVAQVATQARPRVEAERRPAVAEVFRQVVGAVLACLSQTYSQWMQITGSKPVPVRGALAPAGPAPRFDTDAFADAFRHGVEALSPLLTTVLAGTLVQRLLTVAHAPQLMFDEALWAETVFQCLGAAIRNAASVDQIAQMLEPLYLGRLAAFLGQEPAFHGSDPFEPLAIAFEREKSTFLTRLRQEEK